MKIQFQLLLRLLILAGVSCFDSWVYANSRIKENASSEYIEVTVDAIANAAHGRSGGARLSKPEYYIQGQVGKTKFESKVFWHTGNEEASEVKGASIRIPMSVIAQEASRAKSLKISDDEKKIAEASGRLEILMQSYEKQLSLLPPGSVEKYTQEIQGLKTEIEAMKAELAVLKASDALTFLKGELRLFEADSVFAIPFEALDIIFSPYSGSPSSLVSQIGDDSLGKVELPLRELSNLPLGNSVTNFMAGDCYNMIYYDQIRYIIRRAEKE